ncbi:hypothetical protein [Aeromonas simiae]|uniref:Copper chaperone PCu(A)C n=1 Tax=Aeromonas simiae TaxID=218936 RepID=A0A5J6WU38_9GAMM|nr:hypothetical protein [Aeromonas simiae]QFI53388.1 hypothetical protein FE240_00835 [Aeromonas simiae]
MKKQIAIALLGMMGSVAAQAAIPAEVRATPGMLFVDWQATAALEGKGNPLLEVRNEFGDVIASTHASLTGRQVVRLPAKTQGILTLNVAGQRDTLHMPFGFGSGHQG